MGTVAATLVKLHKTAPATRLGQHVAAGVHGFVLRDQRGHEHHFGGPELIADGRVFAYVASYSPDGGGPEREYNLRDALLADGGADIAEPTLGPRLSPLARAAVDTTIEVCARKGFSFEYEKEVGVEVLLALQTVDEPFSPPEVEVYGATNGLSAQDAADYRRLAEHVARGRSFRPAIRLSSAQASRYLDAWSERLAQT